MFHFISIVFVNFYNLLFKTHLCLPAVGFLLTVELDVLLFPPSRCAQSSWRKPTRRWPSSSQSAQMASIFICPTRPSQRSTSLVCAPGRSVSSDSRYLSSGCHCRFDRKRSTVTRVSPPCCYYSSSPSLVVFFCCCIMWTSSSINNEGHS